MKINTDYDLICTGEGISAYILAAIASKYGMSVLLIDETKYENDCLEFYPSYLDSNIIESVFNELELTNLVEFDKTTDAVQLILNKKRILMSFNQHNTHKEIEREYFNASNSINTFFDKVYKSKELYDEFYNESQSLSQTQSNKIKKINKLWGKAFNSIKDNKHYSIKNDFVLNDNSHLENIVKVLLCIYGYTTPLNISYEQCIRSLPIIMGGSYRIKEGWSSIQAILKSYIEGSGNDIRSGISIESIVTDKKGKNITGVLLDNYEGIVHSKNLVIGKNHLNLISKLPSLLQDLNTKKHLSKVTATHWLYQIDIIVPSHALPVGSTNLMVKIIDEKSDFFEENFMIIELDKAQDSNLKIKCNVLLEFKNKSLNPTYLQKVSSRMLRSLNELFPFIKENIISVQPDFININNLKTYQDIKEIPTSLLRYYVKGGKMAQGYWGIPWQSNMENLFFIGKECWPSLGRYGELLSAYNVAKTIIVDRKVHPKVSHSQIEASL